ncbi:MAG: extracellular solute-binding protein [Pseudomonadota bacterium]
MRATITVVAALAWMTLPAFATGDDTEPQWHHASSLSESPGYPEGFPHFDYVNPDAPQEGTVRLASATGFDSFNPILQRGSVAPGAALIYEQLMVSALDEIPVSAMYGLIAEAVRHPDDFAWVEYRIDPDAKWHDGTPITPEDVVWSLEVTKEADPRQAFYYKDVTGARDMGDGVVRFDFARAGNKELPHIVGQLTILPKHWWTGTGPNGEPRDILSTTLEPPLGSGPYQIGRFEANRFVEYDRADNHWSAEKNVNIGKDNFDTIRYDVFRDQTVVLEAFKGDRFDFRLENSAKNWATGYDSPALTRGEIVLEELPDEGRGIMQAFVVNLRSPKFQDPRVRRALNLLYDFEAQKDTIFYGQYERINSFFHGTELASSGLPEGLELGILEDVRGKVPPSVFSDEYQNPVNGTPQNVRENAREAVRLFKEAGYEIRNGKMVNVETGEPFTIEVVENSPTMERVVLPYKASLARVGIDLNFRIVDTSQYINRLRNFDFEMTVAGWGQSLSPGNEQLDFWGSEAADRSQSRNYAGIKDEAVDHLIDRIITAPDRETLVAATKALDRVLLHNHFVVPMYSSGTFRVAHWNRFGHPDNIPPYTPGFPTIWWWDADKAASVGNRS